MAQLTRKVIRTSADTTTATGWIPLNVGSRQENFIASYSLINFSDNETPIVHVQGTMEPIWQNASVASKRIFTLVCAATTSCQGTYVVGEIAFPVAAMRIQTLTEASGEIWLEFDVLQAGKV